MPLTHQPKDIESYELKENKVKILRAKYDVVSGEFFGIEYCVAFYNNKIRSRWQFFDYCYHKDNSKVLYSTRKLKIPNSFKTTIFGHHKTLYESGAFDEQEFSKLYFYLPQLSTETRKLISIWLLFISYRFMLILKILEKNLILQILILSIENQLFLTWKKSLSRVPRI